MNLWLQTQTWRNSCVSFQWRRHPYLQNFAIDGSGAYGHASWTVVAHEGPTVAGRVTGDQTPHAGERSALLQLCWASFAAGRAAPVLQDNTAVLDRLTRGLQHGNWEGDQPFWTCFADHWLAVKIPTRGCHHMGHDLTGDRLWTGPHQIFAELSTQPRTALLDRCGEHIQAHRWASTGFGAQLEVITPCSDTFCDLQHSDCADWAW